MSQDNGIFDEEHTRVRRSAVDDRPVAKKKSAGTDKPVAKKKAADGDRPAAKKKPVDEDRPVAKKKPVDGDRPTAKKKSANTDKPIARKKSTGGKKTAVKRKSKNGRKPTGKKVSADTRKKDSARKPKSENGDNFETPVRSRDEVRARRKQARLRKVRRQKIIMAVSSVVIVAIVIGVVVLNTPSMKLSRNLSKGDKCVARAEYADAQRAYEKALELDPDSVKVYRGMAENYLAQEMEEDAKRILYTGWEQTHEQGLLDYYCIVIYNEAVREINNKNCTLATVDKCIQVLEQEPEREEALQLMGTCYERLFKVTEEKETCELFYDEDIAQDTCSYTEYEQLLRRLLALCKARPSDSLKNILAQYALIDMPYVRISIPHLAQYTALLTDISAVTGDAQIAEAAACLTRAKEVEEYFDAAFTEFESGNYAYARDLIVQESYQKIRDDFINESSGYWEGSTYIPVSREQLVLHNENGQIRFSFLSDEEYDNKQGIIAVWGTKQEDDGVQRSAISYRPVEDSASGTRTEYKVQYLYSNVKIGKKYEPQMNYRFDTEIITAMGTTTNAIGDWGGEHEWEIDY